MPTRDEEADYDPGTEVGEKAALAMLRDLTRILTLLAMKERIQ